MKYISIILLLFLVGCNPSADRPMRLRSVTQFGRFTECVFVDAGGSGVRIRFENNKSTENLTVGSWYVLNGFKEVVPEK